MSQNNEITFRYSVDSPCPVCGSGSKGCSLMDGGAQCCRGDLRDPSAWKCVSDTKIGEFKIYRPASATPSKRKPKSPPSWSTKAVHFKSQFTTSQRAELARQLGVTMESFTAIPLMGVNGGSMTHGPNAIFPEVDEDGIIVGLIERVPDRDPKSLCLSTADQKGHRGLTVAVGWDASPDTPLLIVEGATDVLAWASAGIRCIGRPGAFGGVELLTELLKKHVPTRRVIIVGENDAKRNADGSIKLKPDGTEEWPGKNGAISVAQRLAVVLPNPITWALVPAPAKDSRDWLSNAPGDWLDRGQVLLRHLESTAAFPPLASITAPSVSNSESVDAPSEDPDDPALWSKEIANSHRLARMFLATVSPGDGPLRLRYWRSEFYEWRGGCYRSIDNETMDGRIWKFLETEFERVYKLELKAWKIKERAKRGVKRPKEHTVTRALVANVLGALRGITQDGLEPSVEAPFWLDGATGPMPTEIVACRNGLVDVATGQLLKHTPSFFTLNAVPYDYDPSAAAPARWLQFLQEIWPNDPESAQCLQEWFGYLLTGDNAQQKMLFLFGEPRSGKGTVSRVMRQLIGAENVTSTSYKNLENDFGLWPLMGKSVAVIGDSRDARGDEIGGNALERILNITGQDGVQVNRKNLSMFSATLATRFVVLSNDLPRVTDTSGAFVSRIILLHFKESFEKRKDTKLLEKLLAELPGILNWAIAGLQRHRQRGQFLQPTTGAAKLQLVQAGASPIAEFIADRCRVGEGLSVTCKELLDCWKRWCEENNRDKPGTAQTLGIKLASVPGCSNIERKQLRKMGERVWCYLGIGLRDVFDDFEDISPQTSGNVPEVSPAVSDLSPTQKSSQRHLNLFEKLGVTSTVTDVTDFSPSQTYVGDPLPIQVDAAEPPLQIQGVSQKVGDISDTSTEHLDLQRDKVSLTLEDSQRQAGDSQRQFDAVDWYFTDDLEIYEYPRGTAADAIQVGKSIHRRITPSTVVSLIAMQSGLPPGSPDRLRFDAALVPICDYLVQRFTPAEISEAESKPPQPLTTPQWAPTT